MPLYICIESADTISPPNSFASLTLSAVLPEAVGPVIKTVLMPLIVFCQTAFQARAF